MPDLGPIAHVGIAVADVRAACERLGSALGLRWAPISEQIVEARAGDEVTSTPVLLTWSVQGPPHVELIQGPPGSVWSPEAGVLHHLGFWADDVAASSAELAKAGLALEIAGPGEGGRAAGFAYHLDPRGLRVEVLDRRRKRVLDRWIGAADG
jgi:methylmalonyl-CoA/ethylmalonyl-CoA epimerase